MIIADRALAMIEDGSVIGLGTGRAATAFVNALGDRVGRGLRVVGIPTSEETLHLAESLKIPVTTLDQVGEIAITFDGADEVAPNLDLIKGYGGALVREKIVAASSRRLVILVGSAKIVPALGTRGKLPVEVIRFGVALAGRRLKALGLNPTIRPGPDGREPFVTDNGNYVLDCETGPIDDPGALEVRIHAIPSVVGSGLFLGMAETVLIQAEDGTVRELHRTGP